MFKKSEIYWTRFASFVGVAQMPSVGNDEKKKGSRLSRAFEIRYADALRRLQSRVSQMVMGNNEKTPKELREDILKDLQSTQDFLVKNAPFVQEKVRGVRACCQKKYSNKLCLLCSILTLTTRIRTLNTGTSRKRTSTEETSLGCQSDRGEASTRKGRTTRVGEASG